MLKRKEKKQRKILIPLSQYGADKWTNWIGQLSIQDFLSFSINTFISGVFYSQLKQQLQNKNCNSAWAKNYV